VFQTWTDPVHLAKWWGPKGASTTVLKFDLRVGGVFHYGMVNPMGGTMYGKFTYTKIEAPSLLEWVLCFADADANPVACPFFPVWPMEVFNSISLTEDDGITTLTLRGGPQNASQAEIDAYASMHASMQQGFAGSFDILEEYIASLQDA
jgi:uncharacterized protein YndB with AHSA1/START domain